MTKTAAIEPLHKLFETFEAFMTGTLSWDEGKALVAAHPDKYRYAYGVAKRDGAGVMHHRCLLRGHDDATGKGTTTKPATQPKKIKAPCEERNGIIAPSSTSVGAKIWAMCDDLWSIRKEPFTKSALENVAITRGFNWNNVMTECSRWRKFHGMTWKLS